MTLQEALVQRRSVRSYTDSPIAPELVAALREEIDAVNAESGLHIQLITDEPKAFDCILAHYGRFSGVRNYIALVGKKTPDLYEKCGYYGQRIVLCAQALGLNTCWVALTYKRIPGTFSLSKGEKLAVVIALGYGTTQGAPRASKTAQQVSDLTADAPDWYRRGIEGTLLAPTAVNQQNFRIARNGENVFFKALPGPYSRMDLGIVKYNFEVASGRRIPH